MGLSRRWAKRDDVVGVKNEVLAFSFLVEVVEDDDDGDGVVGEDENFRGTLALVVMSLTDGIGDNVEGGTAGNAGFNLT